MNESEFRNKCYQHGYQTANGKIGTGWMQCTDVTEYVDNDSDKDVYDQIFESAYRWIETLQWEYETKPLFKQVSGYLNKHDYYDEVFTLLNEWTFGYTKYVLELKEKGETNVEQP